MAVCSDVGVQVWNSSGQPMLCVAGRGAVQCSAEARSNLEDGVSTPTRADRGSDLSGNHKEHTRNATYEPLSEDCQKVLSVGSLWDTLDHFDNQDGDKLAHRSHCASDI